MMNDVDSLHKDEQQLINGTASTLSEKNGRVYENLDARPFRRTLPILHDSQDSRRKSVSSSATFPPRRQQRKHVRRTSEPTQPSLDEGLQAFHSKRTDANRCEHLESPSLARILCMRSAHLPDIHAAATLIGWKVYVVETNQEALPAIASRRYQAVVCGFGTLSLEKPYCSPLIGYAHQTCPYMYRIVYSPQQEPLSRDLQRSCFVCGADAVAWSLQSLTFALVGLQQFQSVVPAGTQIAAHEEEIYSSYPPLRHLQHRQDQLVCIARGSSTMRSQALTSLSQKLQLQLRTIPRDFCQSVDSASNNKRRNHHPSSSIRLVHVSDTNNHHRHLILPQCGDVFVHTGNFTNPTQSKANSLAIFQDFLEWLEQVVIPKFELVVFIAGNHDDVLDPVHYVSLQERLKAKQMLDTFLHLHPSVRYLENTATVYRGLVIYGSPTVYCKGSSNDERSLHAFEETMVEDETNGQPTFHQQQHALNGIDILLTNRAPSILSTTKDYILPTDHLYGTHHNKSRKSRPPLVHAFGHNNQNFGIGYHHGTVMMNGSQELLYSVDPCCGGTPLVVNVPLSTDQKKALCGPSRLFHPHHHHARRRSDTNVDNTSNEHTLIEC